MGIKSDNHHKKFFDWLMEVGYVWIGKREYVCNAEPTKIQRRFKVYTNRQGNILWIRLWEGIAPGIDKHEYVFDEESFDTVAKITEGKFIEVFLFDLPMGFAPQLYQLDILDNCEILPEKSYMERYSSIEQVEEGLDKFKHLFSNSF